MINNNTQKKTNVSVGTKKETEIYLKKSELPKDVSSFRNDAGYISQSSLDSWLKEHNYIPENKINILIGEAYPVIVRDHSDGIIDGDISDIKGEIVAIKDRLKSVESEYTSIIEREGQYAKSDDIPSLTGYATEEWVETQGYLKEHQPLDTYAEKTWVEDKGYITESSLSVYAKKSDLNSYAKKSDLNSYVKENDVDTIIEGYNFLTSSDLSDYAKQTDIPDLSGYVKSSTLTNYAKLTNVYSKSQADSKFISKDSIEDIYATKTDVDSEYLSKKDARNTYLQIEDYRGIGDASVINDKFSGLSKNEFKEMLDLPNTNLRNGFYIIDGNDVVIIKDNDLFPIINDGGHTISWKEF